MADYEIFELGNIVLPSGATLRGAKPAYKTFGTLNARTDNIIVYPTWYSGQHTENEWLIGDGMALDPSRYFIIVRNMFGMGCPRPPATPRHPTIAGGFPASPSTTTCASNIAC